MGNGAGSQPHFRLEYVCSAKQFSGGTKPSCDRSSSNSQVKIPYVGMKTSFLGSVIIIPLPHMLQYG